MGEVRLNLFEEQLLNIFYIKGMNRIPKSVDIYSTGEIFYSKKGKSRVGEMESKTLTNLLFPTAGCPEATHLSYSRGLLKTTISCFHDDEKEKDTVSTFFRYKSLFSRKEVKSREVENKDTYSFASFLLSFVYYFTKRKWSYAIPTLLLSLALPINWFYVVSFFASWLYYKCEDKVIKSTKTDVILGCLVAVGYAVLKAVVLKY